MTLNSLVIKMIQSTQSFNNIEIIFYTSRRLIAQSSTAYALITSVILLNITLLCCTLLLEVHVVSLSIST